nr:zinc-ribbon domain-containing protein [Gemmatimonadales bacterium]
MNVTCPNCATVYRVDPAKVPEVGVRARCAVCSAVFAVSREGKPARAPEPVAAGGVAAADVVPP